MNHGASQDGINWKAETSLHACKTSDIEGLKYSFLVDTHPFRSIVDGSHIVFPLLIVIEILGRSKLRFVEHYYAELVVTVHIREEVRR